MNSSAAETSFVAAHTDNVATATPVTTSVQVNASPDSLRNGTARTNKPRSAVVHFCHIYISFKLIARNVDHSAISVLR